MRDKLLFWGVLPPDTVDGISVSNEINLGFLEAHYEVDRIIERNTFIYHGRFSVMKLIIFLGAVFYLIRKSIQSHYKYFYLVFSLSPFGGVKTLMAILTFRFFNRGKVVLHIHRGDFFSSFSKKSLNRVVSRLVISLSYKVIILSENQKEEFQKRFKKPFLVLPNTVEKEFTANLKKNQDLLFVYISNYLKDKGIIDLLTAFGRLIKEYTNIRLETFGAFSDQKLKAEILRYNSSRIQIHDPILGDEKFGKISNASCLVLPSWNEGQPLVILEAMSMGIPVIATRVGLIPELLGNNYEYLVNPHDHLLLENAMSRFIKAKNHNEISNILKKKYFDIHSRERHKENILKIFSE